LIFDYFSKLFRENRRFVKNLTRLTGTVHEDYVKGKAIPLQAWTGPEGSRRLRFPDFKTVGT